MTDLYKQKNNRKVLGMLPYVNLYNVGLWFYDSTKVANKKVHIQEKYDRKIAATDKEDRKSLLLAKKERKVKKKNLTLKEGNSFMRSFGEPPEIYDSAKVTATLNTFKSFLFSKGYFENSVTAKIDTTRRRKRVTVKYLVVKGVPYKINDVKFSVDDVRIDSLVKDESLFSTTIHKGENYDEELLTNEREELYKLLKDQGYFEFQRSNIYIDIDSSKQSHQLDVTVHIEKKHDVYRLALLYFNLNDVAVNSKLERDTFLYKNVHYTYFKKSYLRKLLDYKITIRPYDIYSQSKFQKTQRLLGAMDMYKFVNINIDKNRADTLSHTLIGYINTQPLPKFQLSQEYGMSVGQALVPGPFLSFTLKTRNVFKWLETIENTFRYSFEAQYTNTANGNLYRAREFSAQTSINLSQLLFPTRLRDWVKNYYPKLRFYTGYSFVTRPEYRRETFRAGLTYNYTRNAYSSFYVTPIEISLIDSKLTSTYEAFLKDLNVTSGSNLYLSFNPSLVTDFQFSYVYNNHELNSRKVTKYIRPSFEFGGLLPALAATKYANQEDRDSSRLFGKQIFEYIRLATDVRYYIPVKKNGSLVLRLNLGYAQPFDKSNRADVYALPYEKYFFSGGNSSNRAWKPRRLGPGSYIGNSENGYLYEQPGEILVEGNVEYRFKVISIVNWAFFVDAGNVWTTKADKAGSQFKLPNAFSEIAVGAGYGLRLDFSFLVLRLDLAHRIVDPARPLGNRFVDDFKFRDAVYNIGIGYPF